MKAEINSNLNNLCQLNFDPLKWIIKIVRFPTQAI